jgi:UDP-galactopyranose mutase
MKRTNSHSLDNADLLCLTHLRWKFVFQRPQHLMSRFASERRVFFFEEPVFSGAAPRLHVETCPQTGVRIVVPHLPEGTSPERVADQTRILLDQLIEEQEIEQHLLWYYTPMAVSFSAHLSPIATIYDCMDELSGFKNAPAALKQNEAKLFSRADLVFTGGQSLYEAKRKQHPRVHAFPSSVDVAHFIKARTHSAEPADQASIPHPRLGYVGVIDERMDLELLAESARLKPDWHFVMVGPVVKISESSLPKAPNIHYLGGKAYDELPAYLAGWDVALLPFARNESTKFISPTKTPEYLAAGLPVVSTSIRDVVRPYGNLRLVHIADTADHFVSSAEEAMNGHLGDSEWLARVDDHLATMSWNRTWASMKSLIEDIVREREDDSTATAGYSRSVLSEVEA